MSTMSSSHPHATPTAGHRCGEVVTVLRVDDEGRVIATSEDAEPFFRSPEGRACHRVVGARDPKGNPICTPTCAQELAVGEARFGGIRRAGVRGRTCSLECHRVGDEVVVLVRAQPEEDARPIGQLTARQLEVVRLIAEGLTNPQIAERLGMSRCTVRTHVEHSLHRLGARSRAEAVARAAASHQL